jgi:hypothetical protein
MSVAVSLSQLGEQIDEVGTQPYLVTVGSDGSAHTVSIAASFDGERLRFLGGRTSRANIAARPAITLLWPAADGGPYALIVDGDATLADGDDEVTVMPTRAVLHRVATAAKDLPSCVRLEDAG